MIWHLRLYTQYWRGELLRRVYLSIEGWLREYMGHLRYIWLKKTATRESAARARVRERGTSGSAQWPWPMLTPTEAPERAALALWATACAHQLDGGVDGRRPPYRRRTTVTPMFAQAQSRMVC